jgi:hypothetical protein
MDGPDENNCSAPRCELSLLLPGNPRIQIDVR